MTIITITIPGEPVAKGRPRITTRDGFAHAYTPKKTRDYEALVDAEARKVMGLRKPLEGPLAVEVNAFMPVPASWSLTKKLAAVAQTILPTSRPDLTNIVKAAEDALNGIVWRDDSQIVSLIMTKEYGARPRLVIAVRGLA